MKGNDEDSCSLGFTTAHHKYKEEMKIKKFQDPYKQKEDDEVESRFNRYRKTTKAERDESPPEDIPKYVIYF